MNLFRLLEFFRPLGNPLGFSLADTILLGAALLLTAGVLLGDRIAAGVEFIATRPRIAYPFLFALPVILRVLLLPLHSVPTGGAADDFSFLLLGDTLAHFRLANPTHPLYRFFETVFVLQEPAYGSIYPPGQGIALAIGKLLFGLPWAGVVITTGILCAMFFWMLRAWVAPRWAFLGALIAIAQFGPLSQWMNTYWGGNMAAIAGCMIFGALPRLLDHGRERDAIIAGAGLGLHAISRPFEAVGLAVCMLLFAVPLMRRAGFRQLVTAAVLAGLPFGALILAHNKAATHDWFTLPYSLSRTQYGVPTSLASQPVPKPERPMNFAQQIHYQGQSATHGDQPETVARYIERVWGRLGFLRFFLTLPFMIGVLFAIPRLRQFRWAAAAASVAVLLLQSGLYVYYFPHYEASVACVIVLLAVAGMEKLGTLKTGATAVRILITLGFAQFLVWYPIHLFGSEAFLKITAPYETWDVIGFGDPENRLAIDRELAAAPGDQLVFVHYTRNHRYREWVYNGADIDHSRVIRANDLGPEENQALIEHYPERTVWLLQPDLNPPRLTRYGTR